jgi:anti-sigma factor RsiW
MITCRELAELLYDLSSGELPPERQEHVERHLSLCSHCAAYVETYRLTIQMTRALPRPALPPHLAQQLQALLQECGKTQNADPSGTHAAEQGS